jgi:hypothetical protein
MSAYPIFASSRSAGHRSRHRCGAFIALFLLPLIVSSAFAADETRAVSLNAIAIGGLSRADLGIGMLEGRVALSPHLVVTATPTVLSVEGGDTEFQFRAAATLLLQWGPVRFDDRNLWVFSDAGTTRYRNRLRLTAPVEVSGRALRFQLLDEVFYEKGGRGWFRNMVGVGVGLDANRSFSADAYWMLMEEDRRTRSSMFLLMLTVHVL